MIGRTDNSDINSRLDKNDEFHQLLLTHVVEVKDQLHETLVKHEQCEGRLSTLDQVVQDHLKQSAQVWAIVRDTHEIVSSVKGALLIISKFTLVGGTISGIAVSVYEWAKNHLSISINN